jgi:hypothetical protein
MITITPTDSILRDGVKIGVIRNGIAYTSEPLAGVIKGQVKRAAGLPELTFEVVEDEPPQHTPGADSSVVVTANGKADGIRDVVPSATIYVPLPGEPVRRAEYGDKDPIWQKWFIATFGAEAFTAKWPTRKLP